MLYILLGQDDFSLRQSLKEIKKSIGNQEFLEANTTILDGQPVTFDQLSTACATVPFLAEKRLVIINGLLERFESKSKTKPQKKSANISKQQNELESLIAVISRIPDSTILVLIDGRIRSNNPLLRELSAKAKVKSFPLLRDARLRQWIQNRVVAEGGSISPQAVDLVAKLVGSDLWITANEIEKLILFTSGCRIEEDDIKAVVSYAQEANVFAMVDAILDSRTGAAEESLQQLLQRGAVPAYLLVMLSRQVQMIVRVKELEKQGKSKVEIQNRLGLVAEFALDRTLEQANRYPLERLKGVYNKLLETDLALKTGKFDGELALNILIAELSRR